MKCPVCDGKLIDDHEGMYICHDCWMEGEKSKFTKDEAIPE